MLHAIFRALVQAQYTDISFSVMVRGVLKFFVD
jgi:hypothetical protein